VQTARAADTPAAPAEGEAPESAPPAAAKPAEEPQGTLATDEALAALKEKLAGGKS
jgi:small subunit ribosomal protein S1